MTEERPRFRVIDANASAEEVAAIVAALTLLTPPGAVASTADEQSRWVRASRLASRRSGSSRGEWRLSGRIGRRARA